MDHNRWVPAPGERITYKVPLEDGGYVTERFVASRISKVFSKRLGVELIVAVDQRDGSINIIEKKLVTKIETAEQNLKYETIRWTEKSQDQSNPQTQA